MNSRSWDERKKREYVMKDVRGRNARDTHVRHACMRGDACKLEGGSDI